ncbi:hypothetical protein OIU34_22285 [Pararhizobium sp. BT-229]|uniref:hypothetical protein n=1 Tax=Pararhizobium sp. BT-229 TaxID=2986923 RepID=UPI0021F7BA36|nr:hypothetical protein [Pararhizobium sp. BT-229]MCV9964623.1 hypothetical protein [Pararhizobium sp. BT-229]
MSRAIAKARRAALCARVGDVLTPELLTGRWRNAMAETGNRYAGHCYAAAEALFHMVGGRAKGWLPCVMSHSTWREGLDPGETHWFIRHERTGEILDPTALQFDTPVPYGLSKGCGFLTRGPSKRAKVIMERLQGALAVAS